MWHNYKIINYMINLNKNYFIKSEMLMCTFLILTTGVGDFCEWPFWICSLVKMINSPLMDNSVETSIKYKVSINS